MGRYGTVAHVAAERVDYPFRAGTASGAREFSDGDSSTMSLLDRFRQPKWKHADPAVRLEAVNELEDEAQDVLGSLAREDSDAAVRRRAVARLEDPAVLAGVARTDMDEGVRAEARKLLIDMAVDGDHEGDAVAALAGLDDERDLASVARTTAVEAVGLAAVRRIAAPRLMGSVAGRAAQPAVRIAALALVQDAAERVQVALNSEHKDVALAALDGVTDETLLEQVATRARNKLVARRARALLRERQPAVEAPAVPVVGELTRERLCEMVESLATEPRIDAIAAPLAAAVDAWGQLSAETDTPLLDARFTAAVAAARAHLATREAEEAAAQAEAVARAAQDAQRLAVCERLEQFQGDDVDAAVSEAEAAWAALDADGVALGAGLSERLAAAVATQQARLAARTADAARHAQLSDLVLEAERLSTVDDLAAAHQEWAGVLTRWTGLARDGATVDSALVARMKAAEGAIAHRTAAIREQELAERRENLARAQAACDRLEAVAAQRDISLKDADQALRDAKAVVDHLGPLPSRDQQVAIVDRLKKIQARLLDASRDLRHADDWKRWANADVQRDLCEKAEALAGIESLTDVAGRLKSLRQLWKQASAGPRGAEGDALWQRFKAAADAAQTRVDGFFAQRSLEEAANLEQKQALVEQAEAMSTSTDWLKTADALRALQQQWNGMGPVPREKAKALNARFRAACDAFFTRRKDDLQQRKDTWQANQAAKEALIEEAEQLAESSDWAAAADRIKQLQAAWKATGPVKRQKSEQLWQRFRGACDRFFERFKNRHHAEFESRKVSREQALIDFEALAPETAPESVPDGLVTRAQEAWQAWRTGAPLPREVVRPMQDRFATSAQRLWERYPEQLRGTFLDPERTERQMADLVQQVEALGGQQTAQVAAQAAPAAALASMLKEALASNTIGGKVDEQSKRRAAEETVRAARAAWARLGPLGGETARDLEGRFARACRRFESPDRPRR